MSSKIDLDHYFQRIGFEDAPEADPNTLQKLHKLHTQSIPFENLDPLLGLPVKLDVESLQQKLVHNQRGGYCFENNLLFLHVLKTLGYEVRGITGRVVWNKPADAITSRTHMLNLVELDGMKYLCDVGFGGQTPTGPLLVEPNKVQRTPHEDCRIIEKNGGYLNQSFIKNEWKNLYKFDLQRQYFVDYKLGNWYTSTHPDSHFTTDLTVARAGKNGRYVLHNNRFAIHHLNDISEKHDIKNIDELRRILDEFFNLSLPNVDNIEPISSLF